MDVRKRDGRVRVTDEQGVRATLGNDLPLGSSGENFADVITSRLVS